MREYIFCLFCVVTATGIVEALPLRGKKQVGLLCSLCVICALITPVTGVVRAVTDFANEKEKVLESLGLSSAKDGDRAANYRDAMENMGRGEVEAAATELLSERFSLSSDDITVRAVFSQERDTVRLERISVALRGRAVWQDPRDIEKTIEDVFGCDCTVAIGEV